MSYEGVVSEEDNGLLKGGVIAIAGGGNYELVEDRVGQDVDQEYFSLSNGEAKEVDGDFVGGGVQDGGHIEWEKIHAWERLISLPARVLHAVLGMLPHVLPIGGSVL